MFASSAWPPHLTVVAPFSSFETSDALGAGLAEFAAGHPALVLRAGASAMFGARHTVPVVLLEPVEPARELHLAALAWLEERGVELRPDRHSGAGYRPHVTVRSSRIEPSIRTGMSVVVAALALVERAPEGDRGRRRVAAVAPLAPS